MVGFLTWLSKVTLTSVSCSPTGGMPSIHLSVRLLLGRAMHHQELIWAFLSPRSALSRYFQGALLGLAYFIFDGIGAYFAVPKLLDPTFDTAALLARYAHAMFWAVSLWQLSGLFYLKALSVD